MPTEIKYVCLHISMFSFVWCFLTIIRRPFYFKSTQTCLGVTFTHALTRAMCTFLLTQPQKFIFRKWTLRAKWRHMARLAWALVDRSFVHASICSRHSLTRYFIPAPLFPFTSCRPALIIAALTGRQLFVSKVKTRCCASKRRPTNRNLWKFRLSWRRLNAARMG